MSARRLAIALLGFAAVPTSMLVPGLAMALIGAVAVLALCARSDVDDRHGDDPSWERAATIAARWDRVTPARVQSLTGLPGFTGGKHHRRLVVGVAEYSPGAVGIIERELRSRGYSRDETS